MSYKRRTVPTRVSDDPTHQSSSHGSRSIGNTPDSSAVRHLHYEEDDAFARLRATPSSGDVPVTPDDGSIPSAGDGRRQQVEIRGVVMHGVGYNLASACRPIFERDFHPAGWNWKHVPQETKNAYWEKFKEKFYWDTDVYTEDFIYKKWKSTFGDAYGRKQNEYRQYVSKKGQLHPGCDNPDIWRAWETEWLKPENVAKSEQSSKNRKSEPGGPQTGMSLHTGGSRSANDHYDDLRREKNRQPKMYEVFIKMHQKNGKWVDKKSEEMNSEYLRRFEEVVEQSPPNEDDPDELWKSVVGAKKNRLYGLGRLGKLSSPGSSGSSTQSRSDMSQQLRAEMDVQMEAQRVALEAQMEEQMEAKLEAQRAAFEQEKSAIRSEMQQQIEEAMAAFRSQYAPPPPHDP